MSADALFDVEPITTGARYFGVIDGEEVPLTECDWIQIAPCGCACAVQVAQLRQGDDYVVPDADAAAIGFTSSETKAEAERDRKAGFVIRLMRHDDFRKMTDFGKCPHEPKWGITTTPIPDGYEWAAGSDFPRRTPYKHLAPSKAVVRDRVWPKDLERDEGKALCGSGGAYAIWYVEWHRVDGKMECSRCQKLAAKAAQS